MKLLLLLFLCFSLSSSLKLYAIENDGVMFDISKVARASYSYLFDFGLAMVYFAGPDENLIGFQCEAVGL